MMTLTEIVGGDPVTFAVTAAGVPLLAAAAWLMLREMLAKRGAR